MFQKEADRGAPSARSCQHKINQPVWVCACSVFHRGGPPPGSPVWRRNPNSLSSPKRRVLRISQLGEKARGPARWAPPTGRTDSATFPRSVGTGQVLRRTRTDHAHVQANLRSRSSAIVNCLVLDQGVHGVSVSVVQKNSGFLKGLSCSHPCDRSHNSGGSKREKA